MRIRTKSRVGFGFDLIVGFLLLVLPTTAAIFLLFMDIWSLMRIDNNMKLMGYQVGLQVVNYKKADEFKQVAFGGIAKTLCPNATASTTLDKVADATISENVVDGNITLTVEADVSLQVLGKKTVSHSMFLSSYNDIDANVTYKCKN